MEVDGIRLKIKETLAEVAGLDPGEIADDASFVADLQLDSLALLEVFGDIDYAFRLNADEERLQNLRTVEDTLAFVLECLGKKSVEMRVA